LTDRWFGLAKNVSPFAVDVFYHAVCTGAFNVKYRNSEVIKVKSGDSASASASCKRKQAVLGGGWVALSGGLPAAGGWAKSSKPADSKSDKKKVPDDKWSVTYYNDSVVTHRLLVRAVCKAGGAP
jgi:hypothetical protein